MKLKNIAIAFASIALIASASIASAGDFGLQGQFGGGFVFGGTRDATNTDGFGKTQTFGGAVAEGKQDNYSQAESSFKGDFRNSGLGANTNSGLSLEGKTLVGTGSLSNSGVKVNGNGFGTASSGGISSGSGFTGGIGLSGGLGGNL